MRTSVFEKQRNTKPDLTCPIQNYHCLEVLEIEVSLTIFIIYTNIPSLSKRSWFISSYPELLMTVNKKNASTTSFTETGLIPIDGPTFYICFKWQWRLLKTLFAKSETTLIKRFRYFLFLIYLTHWLWKNTAFNLDLITL